MQTQVIRSSSEPLLKEPSAVTQSSNRWRSAYTAIYCARAISRTKSFLTLQIEPEKSTFKTTRSDLTELVQDKNLTLLRSLGGVPAIGSSVITDFRRGINGGAEDIALRQHEFGSNTFEKPPAKRFFHFVVAAFRDSTNAILLGLAAIYLAYGIVENYGWYDPAITIFAAVLHIIADAAARFYLQNTHFDKLWEVSNNTQVAVVRSGLRRQVSIAKVVVGDVAYLKTGDQIPADGLFIDGHSLLIDESSVTGESDHVQINHAQNPFLFSGTTVAGGCGTMVVTSVGMNTNWGKTMSRISRNSNERTPVQSRLQKLTSAIEKFGLVVALPVLLVLLVKYFTGNTTGNFFIAFAGIVSVVVSTVGVLTPEDLPLAITLTLAYSLKRMTAYRALVKNLSTCEVMGSVTTICTDKTGILTMNRMEVTEFWLGQQLIEPNKISGVSPRVVELVGDGVALNTVGTAYSLGSEGEFEFSDNPTDKAILSWAVFRLGVDVESRKEGFKILNVETFSSEKKRSGVLIRKKADNSVHLHWKGAAEMILEMCSGFYEASGLVKDIDDHQMTIFNLIIKIMATHGLRCIALAHSEVSEPEEEEKIEAKNLTLLGFIGISNQCRPGVKKAVQDCQKAKVDIKMITGDNVHTAKAIAKECGILSEGMSDLIEEVVVTGEEFRNYTHEERMEKVEKICVIARSSPFDKLLMVQCLKQKGKLVAVTGNKTKDAPALREADIGLCMGIQGTKVAKESANIIILDNDFASIATVLKWGQCVYVNIQKLIQFQLVVNITALVFNVVAAVTTGEVPLTAVQLFWVNLITVTRSALSLAIEEPAKGLMEKKPARQTEPLITNIMWRNLLSQAIYQIVLLLVLQFWGKSIFGVSKEVKDALMLNTFVLCQVFKGFRATNLEKKNVFEGIRKNTWFFVIVSVMTLLQVLMGEFLYQFADAERLNWGQWGICVGFAALTWPISWVAKLVPVPQKPIFSYL